MAIRTGMELGTAAVILALTLRARSFWRSTNECSLRSRREKRREKKGVGRLTTALVMGVAATEMGIAKGQTQAVAKILIWM